MIHEVHQAPALELLELLDPGSVDLFVTDPPRKLPEDEFFWLFAAMVKALKPSGRILLLTTEIGMDTIKRALLVKVEHIGMEYRTTQLIDLVYQGAIVWDIPNQGARFVLILGKPPVPQFNNKRSVINTPLPIELAKELIQFASVKGDLVVDPFCGSGVFGEASKILGRSFVGGDISDHAVAHTKGKL